MEHGGQLRQKQTKKKTPQLETTSDHTEIPMSTFHPKKVKGNTNFSSVSFALTNV